LPKAAAKCRRGGSLIESSRAKVASYGAAISEYPRVVPSERKGSFLQPFAELAAPAIFITVVGSIAWLASGVRAGEIARFVPYELGFVLLPGWLTYRALLTHPGGRLSQLVLGWTLGYLLEILAFIATAQIGRRSLFFVYPLVVGVPAATVAWWKHRLKRPRQATRASPRVSTGSIWIATLLCSLLVVYVALASFTQSPLPRDLGSATYHEDTVFGISLAAEALHHWPMTVPMVAGEALHYHLFVYLHMAAIAQVTGIDLSVVVMRLYLVPLLVLLTLQLVWAGRHVGRRLSVGFVAAFAVLFLGELDVSRSRRFLFNDFFFTWLWTSHTFLLGLIFFIPTVVVLGELMSSRRGPRKTRLALWLLVVALLVGCMGAKSYSPLALAGGLGILFAWRLVRDRVFSGAALLGLALTLTVYLGANALIFAWNNAGVVIRPFKAIDAMEGVSVFRSQLAGAWGDTAVTHVLGVIYGTVGLLGIPLLGIGLLLGYKRRPLSVKELWFLSIFAAGLPALFFLSQPGFGQLFVVFFGLVPGTIVAAKGFRLFWLRHVRHSFAGRFSARGGLATAAVGSCVLLAFLNTPLDWFPGISGKAIDGPPYASEPPGLTAGLYSGLLWVRNNTDVNSVLVVNNHSIYRDGRDSKYFYYSAFAQRRVVLESWDYTRQAAASNLLSLDAAHTPFPRRLELSQAVFRNADEIAMRTLARDYGARYLIADKVHGNASPWLPWRARRVFSDGDVDIYAIAKPVPPPTSCPLEQNAGVTAVFGHRRTLGGAQSLRSAAEHVGFPGLVIQQRGCRDYAIVLTGLQSLTQARDFQRQAATVDLPVKLECRTQPPEGGVNAVFGHRPTRKAAEYLAVRANGAGFPGLEVRQDACGDWEVDLRGLKSAEQRREFRREAASVGFRIQYEPG
jgi:hypothetical protein